MKLGTLLRWGAIGMVVLGLAGAIALAVSAQFAPVPPGLGVRDGRLAPCPSSPNCVSTQAEADDGQHYIEPLQLDLPGDEAQDHIRELLAAEPRVEILRDEPGYIHAVFRSATMRFPDDVEFYLDEAGRQIHFRSASRLGRSDVGVNRERMDRLRTALQSVLSR